jgi:hypothetical protein
MTALLTAPAELAIFPVKVLGLLLIRCAQVTPQRACYSLISKDNKNISFL